ncbi:hypothetical protein [Streptomyces sp. NBC_01142]|uniref:hypothetical protein n=1 Tax=Streptomyces sp. NBC_01142 TaxID=2975865 RepID=UPI002258588C|nr:hypothetical protein [Streptomyces sp. NBC_01142]
MPMFLASDADLSSVTELPWWLQLIIGLGLLFAAGGLHAADKRMDSDFLELGAVVVGFAGVYVVVSAVL